MDMKLMQSTINHTFLECERLKDEIYLAKYALRKKEELYNANLAYLESLTKITGLTVSDHLMLNIS